MIANRRKKVLVQSLGALALCVALAGIVLSVVVAGRTQHSERSLGDVWGPRYSARSEPSAAVAQVVNPSNAAILRWNTISIDASGLDHTPVGPDENRVFGEQVGPCRAARAIAIVHIGMFEAFNAIVGGFKSYSSPNKKGPGSTDAAVAQAAHDTLGALFPSQKPSFDQRLAEDLALIPNGQMKLSGIAIGKAAAAAILARRAADGSQHPEPRVNIDFIPSNEAGKWRQDPVSLHPLALGAQWSGMTPFVLSSAKQFRVPPPPAMDSPEYTAAFDRFSDLAATRSTPQLNGPRSKPR